MRLSIRTKTAGLFFDIDGEDTLCEMYLRCAPERESGVLEIGDRHVFTNRANRPTFGTRKPCTLSLRIERKSALTPEMIENLELSDSKDLELSTSKIGILSFVPPDKRDRFWRWRASELCARVFVSDEVFQSLVSALAAGRKAILLSLDIERKSVLKYGWEPDGSRAVWNLENTTEPTFVFVVAMEIAFVHSLGVSHQLRTLF